MHLHSCVAGLCFGRRTSSPVTRTGSYDNRISCLCRGSASTTTTPSAPRIFTINRTTLRIASLRLRQVIWTSPSAGLSERFTPPTRTKTTATRQSARTPWSPTTNSAVGRRTSSPSSTSPRVWRRWNQGYQKNSKTYRVSLHHCCKIRRVLVRPLEESPHE